MFASFRLLLFVIFFCQVINLSAQKKLLDSLKNACAIEKNDAKKTAILTDICYKYFDTQSHSTVFDSLIKYFNLVSANNNQYFFKGDSLLLYGKIILKLKKESLEKKQLYILSDEYYKISIPYFEKTKNYAKIGQAYFQIAKNEEKITDLFSSEFQTIIIPTLNRALSAFEKAKDSVHILNIYLQLQHNYRRASNQYFADIYIEKAYQFSKLINNDYETANVLWQYAHNKAVKILGTDQYVIIGNKIKLSDSDKKQIEDGLENIKVSMTLCLKTGQLTSYLYALNELSYMYAFVQKKDSALRYGFRFLTYCLRNDWKSPAANAYGTVGDIYHSFNDYDNALKYMDSCHFISKELGEFDYLKDLAANYARIYSIKKDFKKAFDWQQIFIHLNDSLSAAQMKNSTAELQTKYETEKKESQISSLNQENKIKEAENKRQKLFTMGSIAVGIIILFFTIFIFRSLQANKKKSKIIAQQKLIVEEQKHLVEEKHKEITDSINYAERIQRSFLATKESLDGNLKEYFVFFQPKDVVSGDFYWAGKLANGNFALATADSTGHGVPGAIMSILNISSLEKAAEQGLTEPAEIFNHTRKTIIERLKKDGSEHGGKDGMDCSLICFEPNKNKFTYSAANNPIWIVRENQILEFAPDKMPVGKGERDNVSFTQHSIDLQKGDLIYAITDGMPDQFGGPKGKKFMYKKLKDLLISISALPMQEQKETLKKSFEDWKGDLEQVDDVTLIGVRI